MKSLAPVPLIFIFQKMLVIYNRLGHLTSYNDQVLDRTIDSFQYRGPERTSTNILRDIINFFASSSSSRSRDRIPEDMIF
ncbi:hypothetical protein C5167_006401 [Papaver somniferum]|uniref:Uncharacterized protein n=1 Tax=Papaver somniferum TaxID=3469 RepID=A0A4Y7JEZ6_PAPSO|nr:hypothetical protein C5167_006401 [Papaver somniferum]